MQSADLTFVHLSDIHFRDGLVGTLNDPDRELRSQLERDLRGLATKFGTVSGLIITGDVAWAGREAEYRFAENWIRSIAEHLRCAVDDVMVIPGNHDVDRSALQRDNNRIGNLQQRLRRGGHPAITAGRITSTLAGADGSLLLEPVAAYNQFAAKFGCQISATKPYWERRFNLGDGSGIAIRGVTSTWLCGPNDSETTPRLLYGPGQYTFEEEPKTHRIVAAHHPPQNMIDGEDASRAFDFHCCLQLFGHKHLQWISRAGRGVKIAAGALQPDRREAPWTPRYNVLQLTGSLQQSSHFIDVVIYPRRWSEEFRRFMPDFTPTATEFRRYEFAMDTPAAEN